MQCYKPSYETCQPKTNGNSLGHKVTELASWAMQGNHQRHPSGYAMASGHNQCYGQSDTYNPDQTVSKTHTEHYSHPPTHYPEHTMAKTQTHCYSQTYDHQEMTHGQAYDHYEMTHGQANGHTGYYASNGTACHGKTEKKMKEKYKGKKEKSHYRKKSKDCKRSCSESDSGSDSD
jgi:hypothetical protein